MSQRKSNTNAEQAEFVEVKGSQPTTLSFFEQNQKVISYVVVGVLGLAALYFGYKNLYLAPREKEAINAMYKAEEMFAKDSFAIALENPTESFDGFLAIIDNYSGTKVANLATYYAGICYLNLGKYQEAVDYLNDYSAKDDLTALTKEGALADAFSELGDKDKALSHYQKAAGTDNDLLGPYYLNKLAMHYYSEGKKEEAIKNLELLKSKFPNSSEVSNAEKFLARIQ